MIGLFSRQLWQRLKLSLRSGNNRRSLPRRRHGRLSLEVLEDRCVPSTVTNLSDHDPGSLRAAIASTAPGSTVDFQPGLTGTITLTTGELAIAKNLTIAGPGPTSVITVSGNHATRRRVGFPQPTRLVRCHQRLSQCRPGWRVTTRRPSRDATAWCRRILGFHPARLAGRNDFANR
jgi:hypothetical protein